MWFLVRSAFWLSIVFALLPWPDDPGFRLAPPVAIWFRTRDAIGAALGRARATAGKTCTNSPLTCFEAAARIGGFAADGRAQEATKELNTVRPPSVDQIGALFGRSTQSATGGPR